MKRRSFLGLLAGAVALPKLAWAKTADVFCPKPVIHYPFRFRTIRERMRAKDARLSAEVGAMAWPGGIKRWRETYPEDFAGVKGSDPASWLVTKAEQYIVLAGGAE